MNELKIGDKIRVINSLGGSYDVTITKLTKTQAIGTIGHNAKWQPKFKRVYNDFWGITPIPKPGPWDTTEYKLIN